MTDTLHPRLVGVAMITNNMTPYRVHLHRRIHSEIRGVDLHTIITHGDLDQPWRLDMSGLNVQVILIGKEHGWLAGGPLNAWRSARRIRDYLVEHSIEVAVIRGYSDLARLILFATLPRLGIRIFLWGDSNYASDATRTFWRRMLKRPLIAWVTGRCTGVLSMGALGRKYFEHYGNRNVPLYDMPNDVDLNTFKPSRNQQYGGYDGSNSTDRRRRLLFVGRLVEAKGVHRLLNAFIRLSDSFPLWDLVIVGTGPLKEDLQHLVPDHLIGRIEWCGFVEYADLPNIFASADLFVLPSTYEPWGVVITEALASGLPVIATELCGAAYEIIADDRRAGTLIGLSEESLYDALAQGMSASWQKGNGPRSAVEAWHRRSDPVATFASAVISSTDRRL